MCIFASKVGGKMCVMYKRKTYSNHGCMMLEILGVAIHEKKEAWKKAVEKNELPWRQVLDTEGEGSVAELYGIVAAPTNVLIDPAGKVIKWSIGEHETIRELFQ